MGQSISMKRVIITFSLLTAMPVVSMALGLGKLQLNSALNQPFDARIELLSATAEDMNSLNVGLADAEAFHRAGVDRPFVLSHLRFQVEENEVGPDFIRVTSRDAIREPFLNFLIEANWSRGRLFREYTVLLDPPLYDPNARQIAVAAAKPDVEAERYSPGPEESYTAEVVEPESEAQVAASDYSGGDYGPTVATDTLWSIADRVRPDRTVSIQQMMLALLRTNPDAFINNNINGLKRGQILRMPDAFEIDALSEVEALAEVKSQYALWADSAAVLAAAPAERAVTTTPAEVLGSAEMDTGTAAEPGDEAELRLLAPGDESGGEQMTAVTGVATGASAGGTLATEQLQALSQENVELTARLGEAETIIDDLKRLIALKDDELAALQQQIAAGQAVPVEEDILAMAEPEPLLVPEAEEVLTLEQEAGADLGEEPLPEATVEEDTEVASEEAEAAMEEPAEVEEATDIESLGPVTPPPTLVDKIKDLLLSNLMIILLAVGAVVLVVIALVFVKRRGAAAHDEPEATVAMEDFPDFSDSAEATAAPVAGEAAAEPAVEAAAEESPAAAEEAGDERTQFISEVEEAEPEAVAAEPEEDPLGEVNVFLAYEHFDQAEEFVRDAISGDPDNLDYHGKLLEVFYAANDKAKYEEAAKVLHDKVGGEGSHWDMAVAMWQEMSPNRALFAEPVAGEDGAAPEAESGGGIMDITADDQAEEEASLDFDLGMEEAAEPSAEAEAEAADEEAVLDITAGGDAGDVLDMTADVSADEADMLDVTAAVAGESDEDLLDVTAAVGLETEEEPEPVAAAEGEADVLDITGGAETAAEDILDVSQSGGEDLLDVTAHADLGDNELEEDLLDLTAATGAGADAEELLDLPKEDASDKAESLDLDLGAGAAEEESVEDDNVIELDAGDAELDTDLEADAGISLNLEVDETETEQGDDNGLEIDLSMDETEEPAAELDSGLEMELSVDDAAADSDDDGGFELDLSDDESAAEEIDDATVEMAADELAAATGSSDGLDLELQIEDDEGEAASEEVDMEGTVEIPSLSLDDDEDEDDDDDDDEDHTVFVPRSGDSQEQSQEDEVATKLDLAKAYVELGDNDSAKAILDEVMNEGNDAQRKQAEELMAQMS